MRNLKIILLIGITAIFTSCASGYKMISPNTINYFSSNENQKVTLEYKYSILEKKYAKKEVSKGIKVVAIKIKNNSDKDLMFGRDLKLVYGNGSEVFVVENEQVFQNLKQSSATYLLYLLLTPLKLFTTGSYGQVTSSTPIGLVIGPGLAMGNLIAASSANTKFKNEMLQYNINGTLIKKGETIYGLIGIRTNSYESLRVKID